MDNIFFVVSVAVVARGDLLARSRGRGALPLRVPVPSAVAPANSAFQSWLEKLIRERIPARSRAHDCSCDDVRFADDAELSQVINPIDRFQIMLPSAGCPQHYH